MGRIYTSPRIIMNPYGKPLINEKIVDDFLYLLGININSIILFDNGTEELIDQGSIILPRHYFIFVGTKDGELQYKPYEHNKYRIVVSTEHDVIASIDSIG